MANVVASHDWKLLEKFSPAKHGFSHRKQGRQLTGGDNKAGHYPMDILRDNWKLPGVQKFWQPFFKNDTVHQQYEKPLPKAAAPVPIQNSYGKLFLGNASSFEVGNTSSAPDLMDEKVGGANNCSTPVSKEEELKKYSEVGHASHCSMESPSLQHDKQGAGWKVKKKDKRKSFSTERETDQKHSKKQLLREKTPSRILFRNGEIKYTTERPRGEDTESDQDFYTSSPCVESESGDDSPVNLPIEEIPEGLFYNRNSDQDASEGERPCYSDSVVPLENNDVEQLIEEHTGSLNQELLEGSEYQEITASDSLVQTSKVSMEEEMGSFIIFKDVWGEKRIPLEDWLRISEATIIHRRKKKSKSRKDQQVGGSGVPSPLELLATESEDVEGTFIEFVDYGGSRRLKLADWLRFTGASIAPITKSTPMKLMKTPSKETRGKREIKGLQSSVNYERSKASKPALQRVNVDVNEDS